MTVAIENRRAKRDSTGLENGLDWGGDKRKIGFRDYSKFVSLGSSEEDSIIKLSHKMQRKKWLGKRKINYAQPVWPDG